MFASIIEGTLDKDLQLPCIADHYLLLHDEVLVWATDYQGFTIHYHPKTGCI